MVPQAGCLWGSFASALERGPRHLWEDQAQLPWSLGDEYPPETLAFSTTAFAKSALVSPRVSGLEFRQRFLPHLCLLGAVQSLSPVRLFATPWTAARQASLPITNSRIFLKLRSMESVMPSNHLILCRPPLLSPSIFPSIRVFSSDSVLGFLPSLCPMSLCFSLCPLLILCPFFPREWTLSTHSLVPL